jgi:hypothetical protein
MSVRVALQQAEFSCSKETVGSPREIEVFADGWMDGWMDGWKDGWMDG